MIRKLGILSGFFLLAAGCSETIGTPVDQNELDYKTCIGYFDCGPGRFCNEQGFCWADCRTSADCVFVGEDMICNSFGQCLEPDGDSSCSSHDDCGQGRYCNGICTKSEAHCNGTDTCPLALYPDDECKGKCGAHCGTDNDCAGFEGDDLTCTPVGQCLQSGWEKYVSPGELPPTQCNRDSQCKGLGWQHFCDCEKEQDAKTGLMMCKGGTKSVCDEDPEPIDFGPGPDSSPAHDFRGVWGMRMEIGVVTLGLPLVNRMNTYSSNLFLVKMSHTEGNQLKLEEKVCEIQLINFIDSDEPFDDLAWMLIPHTYLKSLPILEQFVEVSSAAPGSSFETTQSVEVRGCVLDDPINDPLPTKQDFEANPDDPRFWDEDEDGNVAMTTLMDGILRGKVYNVQRWKAIYHGEILDSDHIRGLSTIDNVQLVISASSGTLKQETSTLIHEQEDRTYHRLMRMPDDTSCADLIREGHLNTSWLRHTPHMMDVADP
jgi:hypothetical protein